MKDAPYAIPGKGFVKGSSPSSVSARAGCSGRWPPGSSFSCSMRFSSPDSFGSGLQDGHLYGNLIDVLNNGAPLMLVAIGMTMVIATGGVDLSVGAVIAISAAMGAVLINPALGDKLISNDILTKDATNTPLGIIILADLAAGTLCGLWNGLLVSRARIQPMVATLILMVAGRGIAQLITNGQIMTIYYTPVFLVWEWLYFRPARFPSISWPLVFIVAWVGVRKTSIGLFVESVGINAKATYYSGISERMSSCWRIPSAASAAPSPA